MAYLELLVIVYGSCSRDPNDDDRFGPEQRRVEITLNPTFPDNAKTIVQRHKWLQGFLLRIAKDMKHNRNWRCEFCTKHARETNWMNTSWMHLPQPRVHCYVHSVCNAVTGPCSEQLRLASAEISRLTGMPPAELPQIPSKKGEKFPMSSSCAVCHNEADESRKNLKQCAKCELTRYCSVDCQRADWTRHKECCKTVKEVKWHWN
ncbi:hypothetical protein B0H15DRAFT_850108 [Mycena belliarum]|uniref:MYND-type domain-containing protein n=1 Tax=Mycena belliarum TaxID=1033014 RepID=A0AAD6XS41_9AGAR|nr:hypothetical protein B0H15DRAFT_850108 [Mycena belliae]